MKRISCTTVGPHVALEWLQNYRKKEQFLEEYMAIFRFAAADVITFGCFYSPDLPLHVLELEAIRDGMDAVTGNIFDATRKCINVGIKWL